MHAVNKPQCFLVFTQGAATFALAASQVHDLLSVPRLTPLEETAPWVVGAFDLHGALTPVVSLCTWLGEPLPAAGRGDLVIVTQVRGDPLGLHADAILGREPGLVGALPRPVVAADLAVAATAEVALPGGRALWLDPARLTLAAAPRAQDPPDARLTRFERALADDDLAALEQRAHRYAGLGARLREAAMAATC